MFAGFRKAPGSIGLLALMILTFVVSWANLPAILPLVFEASSLSERPWTPLTYSFVIFGSAGGLITLLCSGLWLAWLGARFEHELGTVRFLLIHVGLSVLSALLMALGYLATQAPGVAAGPFMLLSVLTVIWGTRYPNEEIRLYGVLPVKAKWLAWISAGLAFFGAPPQLALFAVASLVIAWAYAANKLPIRYGAAPAPKEKVVVKNWKENEAFFDDAHRRAKEREERERLRKLFEGSIRDDEDPKP